MPSWDWLAARVHDIGDPYALALAALALQPSHDAKLQETARAAADRLLATGTIDEGALRFEPAGATLVGATGLGARAEATALAASRAWPYYSPNQATLLAPRRLSAQRR